MWDIETALKRFIKAKKVVVIADACHAGGIGQAFDVARRGDRGIEINPISSGLQNLSNIGDGVAVISAPMINSSLRKACHGAVDMVFSPISCSKVLKEMPTTTKTVG